MLNPCYKLKAPIFTIRFSISYAMSDSSRCNHAIPGWTNAILRCNHAILECNDAIPICNAATLLCIAPSYFSKPFNKKMQGSILIIAPCIFLSVVVKRQAIHLDLFHATVHFKYGTVIKYIAPMHSNNATIHL
jgi:hypothetical protein